MYPDKMNIEDLLTDESFINYCKNTSAEDVSYWTNYCLEGEAQRQLVAAAREKYLEMFYTLAFMDKKAEVERLRSRMHQKETAPVIRLDSNGGMKRKLVLRLLVASSLLAAVFFTARYFIGADDHIAESHNEVLTHYGERKNIQLPDGTIVYLNAGSNLKIEADFGLLARTVSLDGEAFFDVKQNKEIPFIVKTTSMDIKALGTSFDVKAYKNDKTTTTSLITGLVEVTLKENDNKKLVLHPNQKVEWTREEKHVAALRADTVQTHILAKREVMPEKIRLTDHGHVKEIAWKENRLVFDNDPMEEIAVLLERWYGVQIAFKDEEVRNYRFTAVFTKEELGKVLEFLKESRSFSFTIEPGEPKRVYIYK